MSQIDISNVKVSGFEAAIRGMRNSRQSWMKSDTDDLIIGERDLELASKLAKAGGSHAKFRRMIHVQMDIDAPLYWWKEFDTYKVGTTANSTSTMYNITSREFTIEDFATERILSPEAAKYWMNTIDTLNFMRKLHNNPNVEFVQKFGYWREIIQILPESYKQLRTVDLNYEVISHIVKERKGHKLLEWGMFINKMRELPYSKELIFCEEQK